MSHIIYHSDGPARAARGLPRLLDIPPLWLVWWPRQGGAHTAMGTPCTLGKGGWVRVRDREGVEGDKMQQLKNKASLGKKKKKKNISRKMLGRCGELEMPYAIWTILKMTIYRALQSRRLTCQNIKQRIWVKCAIQQFFMQASLREYLQ